MDNRTPSERFWVKVARGRPDECWPWTAYITSTGYGGFHFRGSSRGAHQFAFEERYGPNREKRERYAALRGAGLSVAEARSASKAKVAVLGGQSRDSENVA